MRDFLSENLINLAEKCPFPLYLVGGSVRDFLCGYPLSDKTDWDICAPVSEEEFISVASDCGFLVRSVFKHTGTVKLVDGKGVAYEFTRFRSDKYVRGLHAPSEIIFTNDITVDAKRRDFTANAVYYEIKSATFFDPLGGIFDIRNKTLRTVAPAQKVFGEDGLRLMRLCRQAGQLGFSPDEECLKGAKTHAALILDIVPERVYHELQMILQADGAHGVKDGHYRGLKLLKETGVLARIMPELTLGDSLAQRPDFHDYDVLEHSLRCALYSPPEIRLAALLHDVGKPYCHERDGNVHYHPVEGARIAREILTRLKAPKKVCDEVCALIEYHMVDLSCNMRECKVRRFIVEHAPLLDRLLAIKQADFSACKDDLSPAPCVTRWQGILSAMKAEGAPRTMSELNIKGTDLVRLGVPSTKIGHALNELLVCAALNGRCNQREILLKQAEKYLENV